MHACGFASFRFAREQTSARRPLLCRVWLIGPCEESGRLTREPISSQLAFGRGQATHQGGGLSLALAPDLGTLNPSQWISGNVKEQARYVKHKGPVNVPRATGQSNDCRLVNHGDKSHSTNASFACWRRVAVMLMATPPRGVCGSVDHPTDWVGDSA